MTQQARRPDLRDILVLAIWSVVVAISAVAYVARFEIDNSVGIWFSENDPELDRFLANERIFGGTEWTVYLISGTGGTATPTGDNLGEALCRIAELPRVEAVLAAVPRPCAPRLSGQSDSPGTALSALLDTRRDDGRLAVLIGTEGQVYEREAFRIALLTRIDAILSQTPGLGSTARAGTPVINAELNRAARRDMIVFYGAIALLLFIFGRMFLSTARGMIVLLAILAATILPTMGMAAAIGMPFNLITVMLPTILVAMTCSVSVHALREFRHYHERMSARRAAAITVRAVLRPAAFSTLTTAAGFLSLAQSDVAPVRQVGYLAAFGVTLGLINTLILAPGLLRLLWLRHGLERSASPVWQADRMSPLARLWHRPRLVLGLAALTIATSCAGLAMLQADTDYARFFGKDSRVGKDYAAIRAAGLPGAQATLAITANGRRRLTDPAIGPELDALAQRLEQAKGVVAAFRAGPAMSPHDDDRHARIILLTDQMSSSRILALAEETALLARIHLPPGITAHLTGPSVLWARMDTRVMETQRRALVAILALLLVLMPFLARSVCVGLAAVAVSALPVMAILGLMGWLGLTVNVATCLIGSVAVGVAVDDTIFMLTRARREMDRGADTETALLRTLRISGSAMVTSSMIVAMCFLSMTLSDFVPTAQFGLFFAGTIAAALAADLVVLPTLLLLIRRRAPRVRGAPVTGEATTR